VSRKEKSARWHALNYILEKCAHEYHKSLESRILEVLVESFNKETGECEGRCRENKTIQFKGTTDKIGTLQNIKITKGLKWLAKGELVTHS
jgi:tRNA A37 methylthiotransferase MiaB